MRVIVNCAFAFSVSLAAANAETMRCPTVGVTVDARHVAHAEMVCEGVEQAKALFDQCNLPAPAGSLTIEVVDEVPPGCVAVYHCEEKWIEVLAPKAMDEKRDAEGAFGFLGLEDYFRSVVVHEMSHVTFDDVPCPFEACVAADEYVAYALQVMSLSPDQQAEFEARSGLDRKVSRDELSAMILYMAPDLYARKAWAHLSQREDPCGYLGQIMSGSILLDHEHF